MDKQPEALRLAEYLETYGPKSNIDCTSILAAAELRRLHEVNQELLEALCEYCDAIRFSQDKQALMSAIKSADDKAYAAIAKATGEKA